MPTYDAALQAKNDVAENDFDDHVPMPYSFSEGSIREGRKLWYIPEPTRTRMWIKL